MCFFFENQSPFLWFFAYIKRLTLHNVIILIKSVLNKDQDHCCYNVFLGKYSYQLAKKNDKENSDSILMLRFGETKVARGKFML